MNFQLLNSSFQFFPSDFLSLFIAFLYVTALITLSEILRRVFRVPVDITRKVVHVGVGVTALVITSFFREWYIAVLGPLVFILVNYLSYRTKLFSGIETGEEKQLGTIYFPLAFVIFIPLLWSRPPILAASFMPLTWGDAAAAILGKRWGSRRFTIFGQTSSIEGSLAMFVFSLMSTYLALIVFGQAAVPSLAAALATALFATFAEALSPKGIDNLTVPTVSLIVLLALGISAK